MISYKIGLCVVDPEGKPCLTTFTRLQYRDGVSIVQARPKTGRMHQVPGFTHRVLPNLSESPFHRKIKKK